MSDDEISQLRREMREDTKTILREIGKIHGRIGEVEKEVALVNQDVGNHIDSHKLGVVKTAIIVAVLSGLGMWLGMGFRAWVQQK